MSVNSPYLAAENSMDRRSRGLHRFLVSSPVLLLLAVGLVGHLKKTPHVGAAGTAEYDQRVLAYQPRVLAAQQALAGPEPRESVELKEESKNWAAGFASGKLKALPPAAFEDHLNDSARGEVLRAGLGLASELSIHADELLRNGNTATAAEEAMITCEAVYGLRGFELQAHIQSTMAIRRGVTIIAKAWPQLSTEKRDDYRRRLKALVVRPDEPKQLADTEKQQLRDYVQRQGRENIPPTVEPDKEDRTTDRQQLASERSVHEMNTKIAKLFEA